MGKVVIDYDGFKDVLSNYLAEKLIDEIISCMNDNLVFIADVEEYVSEKDNEKAPTAVMTTEEAMRKVKNYKYEKPCILDKEMISAMRDTRNAMKEVKHHRPYECRSL